MCLTPRSCRKQGNVDEVAVTPTEGASCKIRTGNEFDFCSHGKNIVEKDGVDLGSGAPACEMDAAQVKVNPQVVKGRQSQSGPLMPGIVLGQTSTERSRVSERLILNSFMLLLLIMHFKKKG